MKQTNTRYQAVLNLLSCDDMDRLKEIAKKCSGPVAVWALRKMFPDLCLREASDFIRWIKEC